MKRWLVLPLFVLLGLGFTSVSRATDWTFPVIKEAGPVLPLPDAAQQPDPKLTYKVVFDITAASSKPDQMNNGLSHVARFINTMASAGVKPSSLHLVAVVHGPASRASLNNDAYKALFNGTDNPNVQLIHDLKAQGVKIYQCGQALADNSYQQDWVNPDVTVVLAGAVTVVNFELRGYAYLPFK